MKKREKPKCGKCGSRRNLHKAKTQRRVKKDGSISVYVRYICRPCNAARMRKYRATPSGRAACRQSVLVNNAKSPEKYKARCKVALEIEMGRMIPSPCARCQTTEHVHAHHDDYSKPLEVVWLCPAHHAERHREIKEIMLIFTADERRKPKRP